MILRSILLGFLALYTLKFSVVSAQAVNSEEKVVNQVVSSIIPISFDRVFFLNGEEVARTRENCHGTLVDSKGLILTSNSIFYPAFKSPQGVENIEMKTQNIQITFLDESYDAEESYKDAAEDMLFLKVEDVLFFEALKENKISQLEYKKKKLCLGEKFYAVTRFGEEEIFAPKLHQFFVSSVIETPSLHFVMIPETLQTRGTPALDVQGHVMGWILMKTTMLSTGEVQSGSQMLVKPLGRFEETLKNAQQYLQKTELTETELKEKEQPSQ